ncbi:unnamed protein product [Didymodactylos carnosus]|uniref:Uncharacterized protein n=1 Tax=Didymodactylos carnosus TaxID=1234261 RepID=A0A8S2H7Z0_9BILA|nr:unnamed protein product [Didymodactylos carnosus]CAF3612422.1 unnamed protein product [Didymodactylos carnosus]
MNMCTGRKKKNKIITPLAEDIDYELSGLYRACRDNNINQVERLLKRLKLDEINRIEPNGSTSLHVACHYNRAEIVRMLLKRGADRFIRNRHHNLTPFEEATDPVVRGMFYLLHDSELCIRPDGTIPWTIIKNHFTWDNIRAMKLYLEHILCIHGLVTMLNHLRKYYLPHLDLSKKREQVERLFDQAIVERSSVPIIRAYTLSEFSRKANEHLANALSQRIQIDPERNSRTTCAYYLASIITFTSDKELPPTSFDTYRGIVMTKDEIRKYHRDDIIVNTAIVSTSKDRHVALMFASEGVEQSLRRNEKMDRLVQVGVVFRYRFLPGSTRTMVVKHVSEFQEEREVLIRPMSTFKVENLRPSISTSGRVIAVDMIEFDPNAADKGNLYRPTQTNNDAELEDMLSNFEYSPQNELNTISKYPCVTGKDSNQAVTSMSDDYAPVTTDRGPSTLEPEDAKCQAEIVVDYFEADPPVFRAISSAPKEEPAERPREIVKETVIPQSNTAVSSYEAAARRREIVEETTKSQLYAAFSSYETTEHPREIVKETVIPQSNAAVSSYEAAARPREIIEGTIKRQLYTAFSYYEDVSAVPVTHSNSAKKQDLILDDLSTADLITIIRRLSREIDGNNKNSLTSFHNSTDDALNSLSNRANTNEIIMRLLDQNEMLIKTLCNNYEHKQKQSPSNRSSTSSKS